MLLVSKLTLELLYRKLARHWGHKLYRLILVLFAVSAFHCIKTLINTSIGLPPRTFAVCAFPVYSNKIHILRDPQSLLRNVAVRIFIFTLHFNYTTYFYFVNTFFWKIFIIFICNFILTLNLYFVNTLCKFFLEQHINNFILYLITYRTSCCLWVPPTTIYFSKFA